MFKLGDEVECKKNLQHFIIDKVLESGIYIIEEVNKDGWIWSSKFPNPYYATGFLEKNFHNPMLFKISSRQLRSEKLEEIGL